MSDEILWCVHVIGPDDVLAMTNYEAALFHADDLNAAMYARRGGKPRHEYDPVIIAHPMEWPWSAERHAADMARGEERFK